MKIYPVYFVLTQFHPRNTKKANPCSIILIIQGDTDHSSLNIADDQNRKIFTSYHLKKSKLTLFHCLSTTACLFIILLFHSKFIIMVISDFFIFHFAWKEQKASFHTVHRVRAQNPTKFRPAWMYNFSVLLLSQHHDPVPRPSTTTTTTTTTATLFYYQRTVPIDFSRKISTLFHQWRYYFQPL